MVWNVGVVVSSDMKVSENNNAWEQILKFVLGYMSS